MWLRQNFFMKSLPCGFLADFVTFTEESLNGKLYAVLTFQICKNALNEIYRCICTYIMGVVNMWCNTLLKCNIGLMRWVRTAPSHSIFEHCVKSVQIRSFFWSVFSRIQTEYWQIVRISPYSVRMRGNTDQKNSLFGYLSSYAVWMQENTDQKNFICGHFSVFSLNVGKYGSEKLRI